MSEQNMPRLTRPRKRRELSERRAFVRYQCNLESSCHSVKSGVRNRWSATLSDISIGGLMLRVCQPFQEGDLLALELDQPVAGIRSRLFIKVMYATARPGGEWVVGCSFVDKLTDYELEALI